MSPLAMHLREARQPVQVTDNLNRTVPSGLGTTSDGAAVWKIIAGAWSADGAHAVTSTAPGGNPIAGVDLDTEDGDVGSDISPVGGDAVYARIIDSQNWLRAKLREFTGTGTVNFGVINGWATWTVPADVTQITVDMAGAKGGGATGGNGARVQTTLAVTPGQQLYIAVGAQNPWLDGGFCYGTAHRGGDSSRIGTSTGNALAIAAGGGGQDNAFGSGGAGGAPNGAAGSGDGGGGATTTQGGYAGGASGGTSASPTPGTFGQGGSGGDNNTHQHSGGGGGGGLYGGGGGGFSTSSSGGGGGGSSLIPGGGSGTAGYNPGNGYLTITYTANNHYYVDVESSVAGVVTTIDAHSIGTSVSCTRLRIDAQNTTVIVYATVGGVESQVGSYTITADHAGTIFGVGRGGGSTADGSAIDNVSWTGYVAQ